MSKLTVLEELDVAITTAVNDAEASETSWQIAEQFCEPEADLIKPFLAQWAVEKVAGLMRKRRAKARRDNDVQLRLEGVLGFRRLPARITLKSGERIARKDARIGQLREQRALLYNAPVPAIEEMDRAIDLMEKYTRREPRITWEQVVQRESENPEKAAASEERRRKRAAAGGAAKG